MRSIVMLSKFHWYLSSRLGRNRRGEGEPDGACRFRNKALAERLMELDNEP